MRERERIQEERPRPAAAGESSDDLATIGERGARLLAEGDDAIDRALSGDSRAFLRANRQQGGQ